MDFGVWVYLKTYSNCEMLWTAIFAACELFRTVATEVGEHFDYEYNRNDDDNMMQYLINIKNDGLKVNEDVSNGNS